MQTAYKRKKRQGVSGLCAPSASRGRKQSWLCLEAELRVTGGGCCIGGPERRSLFLMKWAHREALWCGCPRSGHAGLGYPRSRLREHLLLRLLALTGSGPHLTRLPEAGSLWRSPRGPLQLTFKLGFAIVEILQSSHFPSAGRRVWCSLFCSHGP